MKLPCGRTNKNSYLCCTRKHHWWNTYWIRSEGGWWELRCLFCHHTIMMGENKMTFIKYIFKTGLQENKYYVGLCRYSQRS